MAVGAATSLNRLDYTRESQSSGSIESVASQLIGKSQRFGVVDARTLAEAVRAEARTNDANALAAAVSGRLGPSDARAFALAFEGTGEPSVGEGDLPAIADPQHAGFTDGRRAFLEQQFRAAGASPREAAEAANHPAIREGIRLKDFTDALSRTRLSPQAQDQAIRKFASGWEPQYGPNGQLLLDRSRNVQFQSPALASLGGPAGLQDSRSTMQIVADYATDLNRKLADLHARYGTWIEYASDTLSFLIGGPFKFLLQKALGALMEPLMSKGVELAAKGLLELAPELSPEQAANLAIAGVMVVGAGLAGRNAIRSAITNLRNLPQLLKFLRTPKSGLRDSMKVIGRNSAAVEKLMADAEKRFTNLAKDPRMAQMRSSAWPGKGKPALPEPAAPAQTIADTGRLDHMKGWTSEVGLAITAHRQLGHAVVRYADRPGTRGADVVSVDANGRVFLWDSKYRSGPTSVADSGTFRVNQNGYATDRLANAMRDAEQSIRNSNLPSSVKANAVENLRRGNFTTVTIGDGASTALHPTTHTGVKRP